MNCPNCGSPVNPDAKYCSHCGTATKSTVETKQDVEQHYYERKETYEEPQVRYVERPVQAAPVNDQGGCGITLLSFFIPIAGLILWLVWSSEKPKSARAARNGFLAAVVVSIFFIIVWFVVVFMFTRNAWLN